MATSIAELDLHPLAKSVMAFYFEGPGKAGGSASLIHLELARIIATLPTAQVHPAGHDVLKVAGALRHIGRFGEAEALANGLRDAVERRALHQGRTAMVSERTELAGRAFLELTDQRTHSTDARPPRPSSIQAPLAKHGLEDLDLDRLRRLASRAEAALSRPRATKRAHRR
jgi:hypothetical protein